MKSIPQYRVNFIIYDESTIVNLIYPHVVPGKSVSTRGTVKEFSDRSERRMRIALESSRHLWKIILVLTYPSVFPCDGRKVKRDIQAMKRWLKRQGVHDIFWGLEFQKRGAPHINMLLPARVAIEDIKDAWYRIVGSEDPRHLTNGAKIEKIRNNLSVVSYIIGYLKKSWQKDVPPEYQNVGRFWGITKRSIKAPSEYSFAFTDYEAMKSFLKPVTDRYGSMMNEWGAKKGTPYKWEFRGNTFTMWSGSKFVNQFIESGHNILSS